MHLSRASNTSHQYWRGYRRAHQKRHRTQSRSSLEVGTENISRSGMSDRYPTVRRVARIFRWGGGRGSNVQYRILKRWSPKGPRDGNRNGVRRKLPILSVHIRGGIGKDDSQSGSPRVRNREQHTHTHTRVRNSLEGVADDTSNRLRSELA